jgi:wyosine [tRNA(Phe)-imidazoG37] synthetase (radical SAM superfamily)
MKFDPLKSVFSLHPRQWRAFRYVYPVISRRSHGLSLGINLSPSAACSFHCVYCSIDRSRETGADSTPIDLGTLQEELRQLVTTRTQLFEEPEFSSVPPEYRRLNDLAFSGDGEPTAAPAFPAAVQVAARVRRECDLPGMKIVLITNGCYLGRPEVVTALEVLGQNNGEVWAKLDAGTQEYFQRVNRPGFPLQHVLDNLLAAARRRPIVLQSMFLRLHDEFPPVSEIAAYVDRVRGLVTAGGQILRIQVYTVARRTTEPYAAPLTPAELEAIAVAIRGLQIPVEVFP